VDQKGLPLEALFLLIAAACQINHLYIKCHSLDEINHPCTISNRI